MSASKVSRRYSKALMGLCDKDQSHESVASDLNQVVTALAAAPDVSTALNDPSVDIGVREKVTAQIIADLKLTGLTANFLRLLSDRQRMIEIDGILEDFQNRLDEKAGRVRATVTSATELSKGDCDRLKAQLEKTTGKTVLLETAVDPSLLGGVVARVGNLVWDGSVQTALGSMREQLLNSVQ